MRKVIFDISMSLDGFITASNVRPEEPLGEGGEQLHTWAFDERDSRNQEVLARGAGGTGAIIAGRRTYDDSVPWWGADGPTGARRLPVFVVTHSAPEQVPEDGVYTFVTGGIVPALEQAKAAAGERDVTVMGGAQMGQQYLQAGLLDEISIHLVPVLFGSGLRLFDQLDNPHIPLEATEAIQTREATHLRFRILGNDHV